MPVPPRIFTPEETADLRHSYVETDEPLTSIARRHRTSEKTLSRNFRTWGWPHRRQTVRREMAQPAPAPVAPPPPALTPGDEAAAADIEATVHREVEAIRMIVARLPVSTNGAAAERTARALATLTRTLQEVIRLRAMKTAQTAPELKKNRVPTDPDEFLIELARRMDAFAASRTGDGLPDAGGAGVD
ncbi:MAG: hypothetical protein WDO17_11170 [Alphaproteobacteria bacterium]